MSKLTKKLKSNFTVVNNEIIKLKDLSLQAKGLYLILVSLPENWNFSVKGLMKLSNNGEVSTRGAVIELENKNLLYRTKWQDEKGHWNMDYTVTDEVFTEEFLKQLENPSLENLATDNPALENPQTYKELSNKEPINKESTISSNSQGVAEVIKTFVDFIDPKNKNYYANKTQRTACEFLISEYGLEDTIKAIKVLPLLKQKIAYLPSITTPCELRDKWTKISDAVNREKLKEVKEKPMVIFG